MLQLIQGATLPPTETAKVAWRVRSSSGKALFSGLILGCCAALVFSSSAYSACRYNIWDTSDGIVENSTYVFNLPTFTGTVPMTVPLTLGPGDYHYGATTINNNGDFDVTSPTTRVYINGDLTINTDIDFGDITDEEDLLLFVDGNVYFYGEIFGGGFIYATGSIYSYDSNFDWDGGMTAEGTVNIYNGGDFENRTSHLPDVEMGDLCDPVPPPVASLEITVPSNASACGGATITIRALDASNNVVSDYDETITLTTSTGNGNWILVSGSGTLTDATADDGSATYTFDPADNGSVTLTLSNPNTEGLSVTANDSANGVLVVSSGIQFETGGLVVRDPTYNWDVVAGRSHTIEVEYVVIDGTGTTCATASGYSGVTDLHVWRDLAAGNPTGAAAPVAQRAAFSATLATSAAGASSIKVPINNGVGQFQLTTTDVGLFDLMVEDRSGNFVTDGGGNPVTVVGSQDRGEAITVRPFGLDVSITGNSWLSDWQASGGTLSAANAEGNAFIAAGESFAMTVRGVQWAAADDSNADGIPDGHNDANPATWADLSNNATTPAFRNENQALTLAHGLIAPAAGNTGNLSTVATASFSSGATTYQLSYDEVGIIEISAGTDTDYLTSHTQVVGRSSYVGRFIPHHFDIADNAPKVAGGWLDNNSDGINDWTCAFTYMGQPFGLTADPTLTVTAYNRGNGVTQNYTGAFNKYVNAGSITGTITDTALPVASTATLSNSATISAAYSDLGAGQFEQAITGYASTPYTMTYSRPSPPSINEVNFTANFSLTFPDNSGTNYVDSDGVCYSRDTDSDGIADSCEPYSITTIDGIEMRYGRLIADNVFGPETNSLIMPYRTEYLTQVGTNAVFVPNTDDNRSCQGTPTASTTIIAYHDDIDEAENEVAPDPRPLLEGQGRVLFGAPGAGNQGQLTVQLSGPAWLRYDYGSGLNDATATATFQIYQGRGDTLFFRNDRFR